MRLLRLLSGYFQYTCCGSAFQGAMRPAMQSRRSDRAPVNYRSHMLGIALGLAVSACTASSAAPTAQIIVKFASAVQEPAGPAFVESLSQSAGAKLDYLRPISGDAHVFKVEGDAEAAANNLSRRSDVIYAEPDRRLRPMEGK